MSHMVPVIVLKGLRRGQMLVNDYCFIIQRKIWQGWEMKNIFFHDETKQGALNGFLGFKTTQENFENYVVFRCFKHV